MPSMTVQVAEQVAKLINDAGQLTASRSWSPVLRTGVNGPEIAVPGEVSLKTPAAVVIPISRRPRRQCRGNWKNDHVVEICVGQLLSDDVDADAVDLLADGVAALLTANEGGLPQLDSVRLLELDVPALTVRELLADQDVFVALLHATYREP